mmetsp:Transcript_1947/g.5916  ORF Transcript_1947/g.5916 Transcript_1947/m.5916 type:complete len:141 (-) Transcript_1947:392-814(-)
MMAELPGTQMHVTLVPPRGSASSAAEAAALLAAMRALQPLAGSPVRVVLLRYVLGTWRGETRKIGFWEAGVRGLPDSLHYAPQAALYHVTDSAALIGCAPRDVSDFLARIRAGSLDPEWQVQIFEAPAPPPEMAAMVREV